MTRRLLAAIAALLVAVLTLFAGTGPAAATPGPSNAPEYWFDSWKLQQLWGSGARGQGITIAEIDTGVNAALPELAGKVLPGKDFGSGGNGQVDREVNAFGHGTAMASIMVGRPGILGITGIAPDAPLLPIAVPLTGTTDATGDDHLAQAIRWAADHGGKVISMSLGGARDPRRDKVPCPEAEQQAVFYALSKGAVLLAAAGNNGQDTNAVEEPGVCLGVVSVGAVDVTGTAAAFSSRHRYLTMTAPGVNIPSLSRVSGSAYSGNGTSQATAIASAVFAVVWSAHPTLTNREVVARVLATLDRHTTRPDPAYGFGLIDAYGAVTDTVPVGAANPVFDAAAPFLRRYQAFANPARAAAPPPAAATAPSTGAFEVGGAPRLFVPRVLAGLGLAAAGLFALVVLGVVGLRRNATEPPEEPERIAPPEPAPAMVDPSGLVWHEIINAEAGPSAGGGSPAEGR